MSGVEFCGFRSPGALEELAVLQRYVQLVPQLLSRGLSPGDAAALAYNATLLQCVGDFKPPLPTPRAVLKHLSLAQIASLCEAYCEDRQTSDWDWNTSYEEVRA